MIKVTYELDGVDEDAARRTVEKVLRPLNYLAVSVESCCMLLAEKVEDRIQDVSLGDQA